MTTFTKASRDVLLFCVQMFITVYVFTLPQISRMKEGVDGFVVTSFLCVAVYAAINLGFVCKGWIKERSLTGGASLSTYSMLVVWVVGVLVYASFSSIFFVKATVWWNPNDTTNFVFFCGGIAGVIIAKQRQGLGLGDPRVRLYLAMCLRVIPQISLGLNILATQSAKYMTVGFVGGFHLLMALRLVQNLIAIRETPHDPNRKYVFIGEVSGWISWFLVTGAWLIYRHQ